MVPSSPGTHSLEIQIWRPQVSLGADVAGVMLIKIIIATWFEGHTLPLICIYSIFVGRISPLPLA